MKARLKGSLALKAYSKFRQWIIPLISGPLKVFNLGAVKKNF